MALSLQQLRTPVTVDQVRAGILGLLDGFGFQASAWQSTSANRIIIEAVSSLVSDATFAIVNIAGSMFAGLAAGPYADDLGVNSYGLARVQATPTIGQMLLTASAAAPSHTFAANSLLIADSDADTANTYNVLTGGTINPGTPLTVSVSAAVPGSQANIAPNITTLELRTPLVGVSVTNPPQPPVTPVNNWVTTAGTDPETDGPGGRYNARMIGRFDQISPNNTEGAYRAWCLAALPALTRLVVRQGASQGSIRITGATATGGLTGAQTAFYPAIATGTGQIGAILDYLTGAADGVGRRPINDAITVLSANVVTTPALDVAIVVRSPFASDAVARVTAALTTLLGDPLASPIGGTFLPGDSVGRVLLSVLYQTVMSQQGLVSCSFPSFTGDALLGPDDIYEAIPNVTMTITP